MPIRLPITLNTVVVLSTNKNSLIHNNNISIKIRKLTLLHYYHRIPKSYSSLAKCPKMDFRGKDPGQNNVLPLSVISLSCLQSRTCPHFFLIFHNLETSEYHLLSIWVCLSLHDRSQIMHLQKILSQKSCFFVRASYQVTHDFDLSHLG